MAQAVSAASEARAVHETALLTELNLSATTALRATWGLLTKLFVYPTLPNQAMIDQFINVESGGNAVYVDGMRDLQKMPSRITHRQGGFAVNLLEAIFLYYRGSPALGRTDPSPIIQTTDCLAEAGFLVDEREPRPADLTADIAESRRFCTNALEKAADEGQLKLPPDWRGRVLPDQYNRGNLFPPLTAEANSTRGEKDVES